MHRASRIAVVAVLSGCGFDTEGTGHSASDPSGSSGSGASAPTETSTTGSSASATHGSGSASATTTTGGGGSEGSTTAADPSSTTADPSDGSTGVDSTTRDPSGSTGGTRACHPVIAEILPSNVGSDDGLEWAKLYNPCAQAVDLSTYSLGWGGAAFGSAVDLQGSLGSGACFLIGGPLSDSTNAFPVYDQVHNYNPNLSRDPGAMLLYDGGARTVDIQTVPLDCVVWGDNAAGYLDASGGVAAVALGNPAIEVSLQRTGLRSWGTGAPAPDSCPTF